MADFRQSWELKLEDGKWASFPSTMVVEFENKKYLRLRPTHYGLLSLLSKGKATKNASLAASPALASLVNMRNEAARNQFKCSDNAAEGGHDAFDPPADHTQDESEGENAQRSSSSKKTPKVPPGPYTVDIEVNGTNVQMLMLGVRPSKSDLLVEMEAGQLHSVFTTLAADVDHCLNTKKRDYKKRKQP